MNEINSYSVNRSFHLLKLTNDLISEIQWNPAVRKDIQSITDRSITRQLEGELIGFKVFLYIVRNIPKYFPS